MNAKHHIDLDASQYDLLQKIIKKTIPGKAVWAYGSRVTWRAGETSDLDLVVFGCDSEEIYALKEEFDESDLLIRVDVLSWENIPDGFKENIKRKHVVLQEKLNLNGWKEITVSDFCEINPKEIISKGNSAKKVAMGVLQPFTKKISGYTVSKYLGGVKFKNGDTLLARITPSLENGKTSFVDFLTEDEVGFGSTEFIVLRERTGISDKHFLYYLATSQKLREFAIRSMTGSSGRQRVEPKVVKRYKFLSPPLPEQKAIADTLSSLDDKIYLLHRQNKTLEDMAQTLFRKWFVQDVDKKWKEVKLGEFVNCTTGHSYKSSELQPSKNALVTLKNFARGGSLRLDGYKEFVGKYKENQVVKQGDLVVSHTDVTQEADIIGNPVLVYQPEKYETLIATMDLMKVEGTEKWLSNEFLLYLFKTAHFKNHCLGHSNGTTVLHMSRKAIPSYEFRIPEKEKIMAFTEIVRPQIRKYFHNLSAINTLNSLRDTLLPKLMSGSVKLNITHERRLQT